MGILLCYCQGLVEVGVNGERYEMMRFDCDEMSRTSFCDDVEPESVSIDATFSLRGSEEKWRSMTLYRRPFGLKPGELASYHSNAMKSGICRLRSSVTAPGIVL